MSFAELAVADDPSERLRLELTRIVQRLRQPGGDAPTHTRLIYRAGQQLVQLASPDEGPQLPPLAELPGVNLADVLTVLTHELLATAAPSTLREATTTLAALRHHLS